jgi:CheY-like chemotaxis protein
MNPTPYASGSGAPHRALLVDDDKFMLIVVGDLLRELGVTAIITAANGAAAIEAYDRSTPKPDVVLCDLNMPVRDGFELMEQLAAKGFTGGVILFSGMDDRTLKSASLMARFHRLQFLDTLKKPVDKSALRAALAKLA